MPRVKAVVDPEIEALAVVVGALDGLDVAARVRVLTYVCERYEEPDDDDAMTVAYDAARSGLPDGGGSPTPTFDSLSTYQP